MMVMGCWALAGRAAAAEPAQSRAQALKALGHAAAPQRLAAVQRLGAIGRMADNDVLAARLHDADDDVREACAQALWALWSRSGDKGVDQLMARGVGLMEGGDFAPALALFSEVIRLKPAFAEGWNKRATLLYLMGRDEDSLRDCDEVLRRNRHHFGALSGMAQIHLRNGRPEQALAAWERVLQVHPGIDGGPQMLQHLEQAVRARQGMRT